MAQQNNGPSTTEAPYLAPTDPRVRLVSLLSAGDTVPGATTASGAPWRFGGVPDGLGAYDNGDGTVTLLVNHEIAATAGGPHDTGAASGAYVDRLVVDKATLRVVEAQELGQHLYLYDPATGAYIEQADALSRLCSADLPPRSAFYDAASGLGTQARIFLNGEESGAEGRAFGWIATGTAAGSVFELPALGNISFENLLASPNSGERTVVISNEDATGGQLYVYLGEKQREGTDIQRAGLTNGEVYGIKAGFLNEASSGQPLSGTFGLSPLGDLTDKTGAELQQASERAGVTGWLRPEDGAWDTVDPNRYYFVTTNTLDGPSRLWALDFKDVRHPEEGGTFRALLDGTEGQKMLDNITVSADGSLVLQEDIGNNPRSGRVWSYDPKTNTLTQLAEHDVSRFGDEATPATAPFNQDEESSGVLDVTRLFYHGDGQKVFLLDTQAHYLFGDVGSADRQQIVEGGQLQVMYVDSGRGARGADGMWRAVDGVPPAFPTLDGQAPLVVGHRGAAGVRLEETLDGYRTAIQQGADFIEPDVVPTKDGVLIARHEPELGGTTDVSDHPEFANRHTTKTIDGASVSGWFAEDFTLAEIKTLYARERIPEIRPQNTQYDGQFRVATLDEVIDVIKQAEADTGRQVGLIPETKHPTYFKYEGQQLDGTPIHMDTSQMLVDTLVADGFTDPSRVIIQSFEVANLIDLQTRIMPAAGIDAQLFQLLNEGGYDISFNFDPAKAGLGADPGVYGALDYPITAESVSNNDLYNPGALQAMHALYAEAIGPYKDDILPAVAISPPVDGDGDGVALIARQYTGEETSLVADAHAAGLKVVPYTIRDDEAFQTLNADGSVQAPTDEYRKLIAAGVDGFFTDFPGTGRQVVDQLKAEALPHQGHGGWPCDEATRPLDLVSAWGS